MQTVMWHKRRVLTIIAISIFAYVLLRNKSYEYSDERILPNLKAENVWEFIADFSNTKKFLVPHMRNFTITGESGNYDHWKYSVTYEEPLPVWPFLESFGVGHYSVKTEGDKYIISSVHKTCLFHGWTCSSSKCDIFIKQNDKDAHYREEIVYECPPLFSRWCSHVADYTRQDFINNLVKYYKFRRG